MVSKWYSLGKFFLVISKGGSKNLSCFSRGGLLFWGGYAYVGVGSSPSRNYVEN